MKNYSKPLILICVLGLVSTKGAIQIEATSGKLKSGSIKTCNGVTYGNHGDGHWHRAVRHDSGYYPQGGNLGYSDPCGATSSNASQSNQVAAPKADNSEQKRIAAEQAEATRVENERIAAEKAEAQRQEDERIEAERIKAEKLEAERLEKERLAEEKRAKEEKKRLENTNVSAISLETKNKEHIKLDMEKRNIYLAAQPFLTDIEVDLQNGNAKYDVKIDELENFKESKMKIKVTSEDSSQEKEYEYTIMYIDADRELTDYEISLKTKTGKITLEPEKNSVKISGSDYKKLKKEGLQSLTINNMEFTDQEVKFDEEEKRIQIISLNGEYNIPLEVESNGSVATGIAVSAVGGGAGAYGVHTYLKKKRK